MTATDNTLLLFYQDRSNWVPDTDGGPAPEVAFVSLRIAADNVLSYSVEVSEGATWSLGGIEVKMRVENKRKFPIRLSHYSILKKEHPGIRNDLKGYQITVSPNYDSIIAGWCFAVDVEAYKEYLRKCAHHQMQRIVAAFHERMSAVLNG